MDSYVFTIFHHGVICMNPISNTCQLWVGTSGYSYSDWAAAGIYPAETPPGKTLPIYSESFNIVELNYTWYQMPKADGIERMLKQVPPGFLFTAKLIRSLTHEIEPSQWRADVARYRDGISVLMQTGQLMAILIQFSQSFDRVMFNRKYLSQLLDELEGLPLAIEFRNRSWANDRVFAELERRKITLVSVDTPNLPDLFPTLNIVTNPKLIYIRLHGRNTRAWRTGHMQNQLDYFYTDDELMNLATDVPE
jgi:uncharacterized protein YecE (DUF72 family)